MSPGDMNDFFELKYEEGKEIYEINGKEVSKEEWHLKLFWTLPPYQPNDEDIYDG